MPAGAGEMGTVWAETRWDLVSCSLLFGEPTWCGFLVISKPGGAQGVMGGHAHDESQEQNVGTGTILLKWPR